MGPHLDRQVGFGSQGQNPGLTCGTLTAQEDPCCDPCDCADVIT